MNKTRWIVVIAAAVVLASGLALLQFGSYVGGPVPTVGVETVARTIEEPAAKAKPADELPMLLVDVRSQKEIDVSMIPGAVTRDEFERQAQQYSEQYRIVPYCTVGARSKAYTRELRERGIDAVNFEGSIIGWVEEGLPLVTRDGKPTRRVHTWSRAFEVPDSYVQVTD